MSSGETEMCEGLLHIYSPGRTVHVALKDSFRAAVHPQILPVAETLPRQWPCSQRWKRSAARGQRELLSFMDPSMETHECAVALPGKHCRCQSAEYTISEHAT